MISENAEFRSFDGNRFSNLINLFRGGGKPGPAGLIILTRDGKPIKAIHTKKKQNIPDIDSIPQDPEAIAEAHKVRWVLRVDRDAIDEILEQTSSGLTFGDDLVEMILAILRASEKQMKAGKIEVWPDFFEGTSPPKRSALKKIFNAAFPPRSTILFYVFDGPNLYAEVICQRNSREITLFTGHDGLETGREAPRLWRDEYKNLLQAAEKRLSKPSLGIFVSLGTARKILAGQGKSEVSRAISRKDLIIEPMPLWLAGWLGATVVQDVVKKGKQAIAEKVSSRFGKGIAGKLAGKVANRAKRSLSERIRGSEAIEKVEKTIAQVKNASDLKEILGFDPAVLAKRFRKLSADDPQNKRPF